MILLGIYDLPINYDPRDHVVFFNLCTTYNIHILLIVIRFNL